MAESNIDISHLDSKHLLQRDYQIVLLLKALTKELFRYNVLYGIPQYDITEVMNPAGEEEYQRLRDKLHRLRNKLLIYRLLHFHDKLPNIKLNLTGRERSSSYQQSGFSKVRRY